VDSRAPLACYPQGNFWPMIFALSLKKHRFTRAGFPLCSGCLPRSQPGLYPCALEAISIRPKPSLCTPSLPFRGQMPHLNCPGATVPLRLELRSSKVGVSLAAPAQPEPGLHSLPTTLRIELQNSIAPCSKAPGVFSSSRKLEASSPPMDFHRAPRGDSSLVVKPFMRAGTSIQTIPSTIPNPL
jgi:hypothetical protein